MKVTNIEQVMFLIIDPPLFSKGLTFGAMTVAAGVVRDINATAAITGIGVRTELSGAAFTDRTHGLLLIE